MRALEHSARTPSARSSLGHRRCGWFGVGYVDSVPVKGTELARLRTRFVNVPDAPVTKFTMNLFGGSKRGLLENSRDLCKTNRRARLSFTAQNGATLSSQPQIATSCGK